MASYFAVSVIGVPELIILFVMIPFTLIVAWPAGRILRRLGFSPWLGVLAIIPFVNVLFLWVMAYLDWPATADAPRP